MFRKKYAAAFLALLLSAGVLTGCGSRTGSLAPLEISSESESMEEDWEVVTSTPESPEGSDESEAGKEESEESSASEETEESSSSEESSSEQTAEDEDPLVEEFIAEVASVYQMAHDGNFTYGNSEVDPPCDDSLISCDRLVARALWNLGYRDQKTGGMTVYEEEEYLTSHGFIRIDDQADLRRGDIVMQDNGQGGEVNWHWHTFVLVSYDPETTACQKYDCGHYTPEGEERIQCDQPFDTVLADFGDERNFYCGFRRVEDWPAESAESSGESGVSGGSGETAEEGGEV